MEMDVDTCHLNLKFLEIDGNHEKIHDLTARTIRLHL